MREADLSSHNSHRPHTPRCRSGTPAHAQRSSRRRDQGNCSAPSLSVSVPFRFRVSGARRTRGVRRGVALRGARSVLTTGIGCPVTVGRCSASSRLGWALPIPSCELPGGAAGSGARTGSWGEAACVHAAALPAGLVCFPFARFVWRLLSRAHGA